MSTVNAKKRQLDVVLTIKTIEIRMKYKLWIPGHTASSSKSYKNSDNLAALQVRRKSSCRIVEHMSKKKQTILSQRSSLCADPWSCSQRDHSHNLGRRDTNRMLTNVDLCLSKMLQTVLFDVLTVLTSQYRIATRILSPSHMLHHKGNTHSKTRRA